MRPLGKAIKRFANGEEESLVSLGRDDGWLAGATPPPVRRAAAGSRRTPVLTAQSLGEVFGDS